MSKKLILLIFLFCVVKLTLHIIADVHSGFQGDELLHIATGNHPSWGYMEFPPVIGWLAHVQNLVGSTAVFVHHIFSHLASILIFIVIALTVVALGGRSIAVFIYLWVPTKGELPTTVIAFTNGEAGINFFQDFFKDVSAVKRVYNPYADVDKDLWQTIYICKRPKTNFEGLKREFKSRVFE